MALVLDIDNTLIKSFDGPPPGPDFMGQLHPHTRQRIRVLPRMGMWFVLRPYAEDLLRWTKLYIDEVVIWSAGTDEYVLEITEQLAVLTDFNLVLSRDHCEPMQDVYTKPLIDLTSYGKTKYQFDDRLIIDDRPYSFQYNPRHGVLIPEYDPTMTDLLRERPGNWDSHLLDLMNYFAQPEVIDYFNRGWNITQIREQVPMVLAR